MGLLAHVKLLAYRAVHYVRATEAERQKNLLQLNSDIQVPWAFCHYFTSGTRHSKDHENTRSSSE